MRTSRKLTAALVLAAVLSAACRDVPTASTSAAVVAEARGSAGIATVISPSDRGVAAPSSTVMMTVGCWGAVAPNNATIDLGQGRAFDFIVQCTDGTYLANPYGTYWSFNTGVLTHIGWTPYGGIIVRGAAIGITDLIASVGGQSGPYGVSRVTVRQPPALRSITISPASASITAGGSVQLSAQGVDQYGAPYPVSSFSWSSANAGVASVSSSGLVQGVAAGTATVQACSGSVCGSSSVSVSSAPPPSLNVWITPFDEGTIKFEPGTYTFYGNAQGGGGSYSYHWYVEWYAGEGFNDHGVSPSLSLDIMCPQWYDQITIKVVATDGAGVTGTDQRYFAIDTRQSPNCPVL